jgi:hypothetical protein
MHIWHMYYMHVCILFLCWSHRVEAVMESCAHPDAITALINTETPQSCQRSTPYSALELGPCVLVGV